jgi:hypothetical protein
MDCPFPVFFSDDMPASCLVPNLFGVMLILYKMETEYFYFSGNPRLLGPDISVRSCSASRPNVIPVQATETYRRNRILVEGCGSHTSPSLYFWGKHQVPVFRRLGWPPSRSGVFLRNQILYPCRESNPGSFSR